MPAWLFSPSRANRDADLLLQQVITASRNPALFGEGRVPDTLDGRFEVVALHAALTLLRLRQTPEAEPLAQAFVDALFRYLDSGLREDGVGDLAVPKRVHKLAGALYGRADVYTAALLDTDANALSAALTRNILRSQTPFTEALARHVRAMAAAQADLPWQALLTDQGWRRFAA